MYEPDSDSLPLLGNIKNLLPAAVPINDAFERQPRFLAKIAGDAIYIDSELQLDTDGWPEGRNKGDPTWQRETSWSYGKDVPINANQVPYFVLPKGGWETPFDIALSDYAAVIFKKRLAFAVFADRGHETRLGEGSMELLRQLGEERLRPDGRVINRGMGPGIITIIFPKSGARKRFTDQSALLTAIEAHAPPLFTALGGVIPQAPLVG
jgi:Fungal chitosanase of glycosyl hydrolase group 75